MASVYSILAIATLTTFYCSVFTNSVHINVKPQMVRPNDKYVVFTCAGANGTMKMTENIIRIRLMKLDEDDQWKEVAVLDSDGSIDMIDVNATADGRLGNVPDSYLVVTWPVAPDHINGRYRCDAIRLTSTWDVVTEQSTHLDVNGLSTDLSYLLERLKKSEKTLVWKINETIHGAKGFSTTDLFSVLDHKFNDLKEHLNNKTTVGITRTKDEVKTVLWPAGRFNLLMPNAGCPIHPPAWIKSFHKMKALPGDKYYPIDIPLYLAHPHKKNGFIYRQFCELPASTERTKPWPAGSYCMISMYKPAGCPDGFRFSRAYAKIPDDQENRYVYYYGEYSRLIGTFSVSATRFCCRHDGSALTPIELPVSHPFYLFRHGGRCQEVKGMDVAQDVFMMDTVNDDDYDKWDYPNEGFQPDVSFKPYKEELCYYTRKTV